MMMLFNASYMDALPKIFKKSTFWPVECKAILMFGMFEKIPLT
jgi:hypothetical protein